MEKRVKGGITMAGYKKGVGHGAGWAGGGDVTPASNPDGAGDNPRVAWPRPLSPRSKGAPGHNYEGVVDGKSKFPSRRRHSPLNPSGKALGG